MKVGHSFKDSIAPGAETPTRDCCYPTVCVDDVVGRGLIPTPALMKICRHLGDRLPGLRREGSKIVINRDTVKAAQQFQEEIKRHKEEAMDTTDSVLFISKEKNIYVFCWKNMHHCRWRLIEGPCPGIEVETAMFVSALTSLEKWLSGSVEIV